METTKCQKRFCLAIKMEIERELRWRMADPMGEKSNYREAKGKVKKWDKLEKERREKIGLEEETEKGGG